MRSISVFVAFFVTCIATTAGMTLSPEDMGRNNFRKLALANNELAFNLHRKLASGSSKNVFFSPLSISTAFGMLLYGARGRTAEELRKTLGYEKAELLGDLVHETFSHYFNEVLQSGNSTDGYVLNSANSILVDNRLGMLEEYRRNVQELYKANVQNVDFVVEGPKIVKEINNWVKEKTNGKIEKIVDRLIPQTTLVMLNAVYFMGNWRIPFKPSDTWNEVFYNNGLESEAKNVSMMHRKQMFPVIFLDGFQVLELPYRGRHVSMLIFLPNERNGLQALEKSLTPEKLTEVLSKIRLRKVSISVPKFKLEFEKELSGPLRDLGANRVFNGGDFSGMTSSRSVSVSQILHKAVIEVNEEGSEAAAVTRFGMRKSKGYVHLIANHPFLFALVEKSSTSNMVLFLGRVNKI